ncbi:MAG: acetyl-CoA carboxylase biotin carboxyl carrier protein [Vicingaceae bacterium]
MKLSEIQELIKFVSKSGVSEVEIEDKDFKLNIKTPPFKRGKQGQNQEPQQVVTQMIPAQQMPMQQQMPAAMPQAQPQQQQAPAQAEQPKATEKKEVEEENNYVEIKSPMIGTFYRKPSPDKPEFAKVGDTVSEGDTVCVIEAMKLFNEIESEVSGKIVKVLVDDSTPVEYDQPLFLVEPA